ncbi:hypothetical protein AKJ41_05830 [candidate division MSBL1 archaeon SCGC-AAA259O05]|uniref:DUF106 domain-containing protein n=1 Tax=candidate division MSBL1 archaeon SCGC-AAA259O05 TaxID=1698271 RepID=A0A133UYE7_9EURY|nr:hypothetical protein AKJ41_05830 [candidate division MSBL1 archaeon SCGC-AAA259O05]
MEEFERLRLGSVVGLVLLGCLSAVAIGIKGEASDYSNLIILSSAILVTFISTVLCRVSVDWIRLESAKEAVEDWKKEMRKAQQRKSKKRRKLELQDEEARKEYEKTWLVTIKQSIFYLAPFFLFLAMWGYFYGGQTVVELPFGWFSSGALQWIGESLGFLGWFFLSYFGFAYVWRKLLLTDR